MEHCSATNAVAKRGFRGALNQPSKDHEEVESEATPSGRSEHTRSRTEQPISLLEPEAQGLKGQAHMSCELESQTWKNRYRIFLPSGEPGKALKRTPAC